MYIVVELLYTAGIRLDRKVSEHDTREEAEEARNVLVAAADAMEPKPNVTYELREFPDAQSL